MVSLFREKSTAAVIWLIIVFVLVHAHFILHQPQIIVDGDNDLSDKILQPLQSLQPLFITLIYSLLIITQALRLNYILNDERMFTKAAFTTAMSYILLTAIYPAWQNVSAALICNTIFIWMLRRIFKFYQPNTTPGYIFNTGFICGAAVLLYQCYLPLVLILFFAIGILRAFRFTEWLMLLLGIATPLYILMAYLFLSNNWNELILFLPKIHPHVLTPENKKLVLFTCITGGLLIMTGAIVLQQYLPRMIIQVRKSWSVVFITLLLLLPVIFLMKSATFDTIFITMIPTSAIASCVFAFPKRSLFPAFLFWLTVAAIIYNNWFL